MALYTFSGVIAQQNPHPYFKNYNTSDGLPSPEVYCVFEDSKERMWFGTDNGVSRFDGYEFHNYGPKQGLNQNVVFDILEDAQHRIWFGTMGGEIFILENDSISPYQYNHIIDNYDEGSNQIKLHLAKQTSTVYLEIKNIGVLRIDSLGNDSLFTSKNFYTHFTLDFQDLEHSIDVHISKGFDTEIQKAVQEVKKKKTQVIEIRTKQKLIQKTIKDPTNQNFYKVRVYKLKSEKDGYLIFGDELSYLKGDTILWTIPTIKIHPVKIVEQKNGSIWICQVNGNGLRRYRNVDDLKLNKYDVFLLGESISNCRIDQRGDIWATSIGKGIFYAANPEVLVYNSTFGFSEDFVSTIAIKNENELFVGCSNGDIFHIDLSYPRIIKQINAPNDDRNFDLFYEESKDRLWKGNLYFQTGKWNISTNKFVSDKDIYDQIIPCKRMNYHAPSNNLYCSGANGFFIVDLSVPEVADRYEGELKRVFSSFQNSLGQVWISTGEGVFKYINDKLIPPSIIIPAFQRRIEDISELPDGRLVLATKGAGIILWNQRKDDQVTRVLWNQKNDQITQITDEDGLSANMIEDVHIDDQGVLWVGTLNGLNKITFDKDNNFTIRQFNTSNSLASNEIYQIKSYKEQIWLCSSAGLIHFKERPINDQSTIPKFQDIQVNGLSRNDNLYPSFSHTENNLIFKFITTRYHQGSQIKYRYKLQETDEWQHTINRSVHYPQLNNGDYRFMVQAQNEDGFWSETAAFPFSINPPWWKTWWAFFITFFGVIGSIALYNREQRKKLKKEKEIQQQMLDLERSALQAQMNPHFIFNCLNSIQNFILKNDTDNAVRYLAKFAQFIRQVLNVSISSNITLSEEIGMIKNYLQLEKLRLKEKLNFTISVDKHLDVNAIELPPLLIQPYVENAIKHGISNKKINGEVNIQYKKVKDYLEVIVQDNGPGVNQNKSNLNQNAYKPVGMFITKQRLKALSQSKNDSNIEIGILNQDQTGTEVIVKIKIKNNNT